ncbi:centaurin-beta-2 [Alternaria alternata]|nr:centaurin-beta-2 [Alternaria alternata]
MPASSSPSRTRSRATTRRGANGSCAARAGSAWMTGAGRRDYGYTIWGGYGVDMSGRIQRYRSVVQ